MTTTSRANTNAEWPVWLSGQGSLGLLVLPGVLGGGPLQLELFSPAATHRRVMVMGYPVLDSLAKLIEGCREVLDAEGIERTAVYGGSFGGFAAQLLTRRYPQRVDRLLLSGTGVPDPALALSNRRWQRRSAWLPLGVVRVLLRLVVRLSLAKVAERGPWLEEYGAGINALNRPALISRYQLSAEFNALPAFLPEDLAGWPGRVLILEGEKDAIAGKKTRAALRAAYPQAETHVFPGSGHGAALVHRQEWARVVAEFLA